MKLHINIARLGLLLLLCSMAACSPKLGEQIFSGRSMGTTWAVKVVSDNSELVLDNSIIQAELDRVENAMSNWLDDSDVSKFNHIGSGCILVSEDTQFVVNAALDVSNRSQGYFDPTLEPLIELWGFGTLSEPPVEPDAEQLRDAKNNSGFQYLSTTDRQLCKRIDGLHLNLSAIAKGYAVDLVAQKLEEIGYQSFLVEVGGELFGRGLNLKGQPWRIGIELPDYGFLQEVHSVLALDNLAVATSGDYRNYYELDGQRFSHILDPHTGRPAGHQTASVTVLHSSAMLADAWATALLAAGAEQGAAIAEEEGIQMLMILRDGTEYKTLSSAEWAPTKGIEH